MKTKNAPDHMAIAIQIFGRRYPVSHHRARNRVGVLLYLLLPECNRDAFFIHFYTMKDCFCLVLVMVTATLSASAIEYKGPRQQQQSAVCEDQVIEQDCQQYVDSCRWHKAPDTNDCKSSLIQVVLKTGFNCTSSYMHIIEQALQRSVSM